MPSLVLHFPQGEGAEIWRWETHGCWLVLGTIHKLFLKEKEGKDVYRKILRVTMSSKTAGGDASTWQIELIE